MLFENVMGTYRSLLSRWILEYITDFRKGTIEGEFGIVAGFLYYAPTIEEILLLIPLPSPVFFDCAAVKLLVKRFLDQVAFPIRTYHSATRVQLGAILGHPDSPPSQSATENAIVRKIKAIMKDHLLS